jgi:vacuolar protein sorting-associated protein 3
MAAMKNQHVRDIFEKVEEEVLTKIFPQAERMSTLHTLLHTFSNIIHLTEPEPVLKRTSQYSVLCLPYKERGEDAKLLNAWPRSVLSVSLHPESCAEVFIS